MMGFECVPCSRSAPRAEADAQWLRSISLILGVPSPVAGHDVHPAVPIEVTGAYSVPPSCETVQPERFCPILPLIVLATEDADWPPVTREDQFRQSVTVQVAEH